MKILILGGDGMLGHQLLNSFKNKFESMQAFCDDFLNLK